MKHYFKKMILPVTVCMIAVAAAFASQGGEIDHLALEQGYINAPIPCQESVMCSTTGLNLCTDGTHQVYGRNSATQCKKKLFKP